jgi:hypothetical protein
MGESAVQQSLEQIAGRLDAMGIDYVVVGGMALVAHGYNRTTVDVDILVTTSDLAKIHERLEGLGYARPFAGSKHLRDTSTNVRIEFLTAGGFPGDGKPKPISFPDPKEADAVMKDGVRYIGLYRLIELKLASGMTGGVGRLKDIADIVELCRALDLGAEVAQRLHPIVREKFLEIVEGLERDTTDHGGSAIF